MTAPRFIRWFSEVGIGDVALVDGKSASLGEMYRELTPQGIRVPNGFAITAEADDCKVRRRHGSERSTHVEESLGARVPRADMDSEC